MYLHRVHYTFQRCATDGSTNGVQLTQQALTNEIGSAGSIFAAIALFFFAFSSILGNYYYGEANVRYLTRKKWILNIYRILVGGMVHLRPRRTGCGLESGRCHHGIDGAL